MLLASGIVKFPNLNWLTLFPQQSFSLKSSMVQQAVYETLSKIFRKHGALRVNTPLLLPRNRELETSEMCVNLMTHSGGLVSLAYDLRVSWQKLELIVHQIFHEEFENWFHHNRSSVERLKVNVDFTRSKPFRIFFLKTRELRFKQDGLILWCMCLPLCKYCGNPK